MYCGPIISVIAGQVSNHESSSNGPNSRAKRLILVRVRRRIIVFVGALAGGISPIFTDKTIAEEAAGALQTTALCTGTWRSEHSEDGNKRRRCAQTIGGVNMLKMATFVKKRRMGSNLLFILALILHSFIEASLATSQEEVTQTPLHTDRQMNMMKGTSLIKRTSLGDSLLLILALIFHSVFEGIAIGVAATKADAWRALWTVCLHKIFAAIAMGIALLRIIPKRPFLSCAAYAFAFAISSPIGIGIGILIDATTQGRIADWIYAISMGFACGVFVYVAINHLLLKGIIHNPQNRIHFDKPFYKYLAVVFGAGLIAVVMIWDY